MLSKLYIYKYNNCCNKFIEILNSFNSIITKQIKDNTKTFIYKGKITIEDIVLYRFGYIEKGYTFSRVLGKINNDKLKENNDKTFKLNSISTIQNLKFSFI